MIINKMRLLQWLKLKGNAIFLSITGREGFNLEKKGEHFHRKQRLLYSQGLKPYHRQIKYKTNFHKISQDYPQSYFDSKLFQKFLI